MPKVGDGVFASELVVCIADARDPTVHELFTVARQVWMEGAAERFALRWEYLPSADPDRLMALRVAQAALCGSTEAQ